MYGDLASITPPITVPAWACAMTGKTPGQLGIYGFRNRKDTSYDGLSGGHLAQREGARGVGHARRGRQAIAADRRAARVPASQGVPRLARRMLPDARRAPSGTPSRRARDRDRGGAGGARVHLRHPELPPAGRRLRDGPDLQDDRATVPGRPAADQDEALGLLHDGARSGLDRLHHCFWQFYDARHPLYEAGNKYETAFHDYYRFLDKEIGSLLEVLPEDVITIAMSDHGARPMMGGLCFNDWLIQEGYLVLKEPVREVTPDRQGRHRLEPHGGLGRRRLLRAVLPQHQGARAAVASSSRRSTRRCATR